MRYLLTLLFLVAGCGDITVTPPEETLTDPAESTDSDGPDTSEETTTTEEAEEDSDGNLGGSSDTARSSNSVCESVVPAGMMDLAIQKSSHFYETAGEIQLYGRTSLSPDEETGERLMYGDSMRMWVKIPELIRPISGRGSHEVELCLTVGNVNCRYIWGAKLFELDFCDLGVQAGDVLGARFYALQVNNTDLAPDVEVRAVLSAVSPIR